jgi:hypothetical protein
VGFVLDQRERASVAEQLHDPACGFRVTGAGVHLWRFGLNELAEELAAPSGPAVELALILGLPFSRLRLALPDELFTAEITSAFGRRHGFSVAGMRASATLQKELLRVPRKSEAARRLSAAARISVNDPAAAFTCEPCAAWCGDGPSPARFVSLAAVAAAVDEAAKPVDTSDLNLDLTQDSRVALEEFVGTGALAQSMRTLHRAPADCARRRNRTQRSCWLSCRRRNSCRWWRLQRGARTRRTTSAT